MNTNNDYNANVSPTLDADTYPHHTTSAVAWGAIFAGAAAAAALSLILLMLGTGLGLSSVSPWAYSGISAKSFGVSSILWITFTSIVASGMGGYLAGRLRTRWLTVHGDEVHFRDTVHGFLAWAVATLATAALLTSTIGSILNAGVQASASAAGAMVAGATEMAASHHGSAQSNSRASANGQHPSDYFIDYLFRAEPTAVGVDDAMVADPSGMPMQSRTESMHGGRALNAEVTRIFVNAAGADVLPAEDVRYLGSVIAKRRGISQQDAEQRVTATYARLQTQLRETEAKAKEAADKARKAAAVAALWLFISLLSGAFVASLSATFGGRQRDA